MQQAEHIVFGPFRFDLTMERLWREGEIPYARGKGGAALPGDHPGV